MRVFAFGLFGVGALLWSLSGVPSAFAEAEPVRKPASVDTPVSRVLNDDLRQKIKPGYSMAPILAYDATFGLAMGGAFFHGRTEGVASNFTLIAFATSQKNYGFESTYKTWFADRYFFYGKVAANNLYTPYYGEGNQTLDSDRVNVDGRLLKFHPVLGYRWSKELTSTYFSEIRHRTEAGVDGDDSRRVFGNNFTPLFGSSLIWDGRDSEADPKDGSFHELKLNYGPSILSRRENAEDFVQLETESKKFISVGPRSVVAMQFLTGASFGDPGSLYRYPLGTDRILRGYRLGRFRGQHFYAGQAEWRQSLNRYVSVVGFAGAGDVADHHLSDFKTPKWVVGPGLRVGLPPDFIAKARFDFGIGSGETAFYVNFNEAF